MTSRGHVENNQSVHHSYGAPASTNLAPSLLPKIRNTTPAPSRGQK